jgi:hypothetical protein
LALADVLNIMMDAVDLIVDLAAKNEAFGNERLLGCFKPAVEIKKVDFLGSEACNLQFGFCDVRDQPALKAGPGYPAFFGKRHYQRKDARMLCKTEDGLV